MPDTTYPFTNLAGAGVAFKLLSAVTARAFVPFEYERRIADFVEFAAL